MRTEPVLILQGGAGKSSQDPARLARIREKIKVIMDRAYAKLRRSSALDAAAFAVRLLEDDPDFNAGTGSLLQRDGRARLSASVMDGSRLRFAAVLNLEKIRNPILVAKALLKSDDRVLAGEGAFRFAKTAGFKIFDTRTADALSRWKKQKARGFDTVGACALDRFGNLASATSTGGRGMEMPGRVSDSGMPVANYANRRCAVSATGIGEEIIEEGLAVRIATRVADGMALKSAFQKTFREVRANGHRMGAVGLDRKGHITWGLSTESLIYGWRKGGKTGIF